MRGDILMARKQYREAVEAYTEEKQIIAVLVNKLGIAFHQMLELDLARKHYEHAAKLDPKYSEAVNNLGTVYYAKKSYRRAISQYNKALKLSPNSASIYSNLGTAQFARKKYKEAAEAYDKALSLDPEVFERRSFAWSASAGAERRRAGEVSFLHGENVCESGSGGSSIALHPQGARRGL